MNADLTAWLEERNQCLNRVRRVLIEKLHVPRTPDEIDPDAPLFGTGLALDSVDAVELVVSLEAEFGFRLDDEALARPAMRTVNTLVDLVLRKQGQRHVAPGTPPLTPISVDTHSPLEREVKAIRTTTALCETSATVALRVSGSGAFATLDSVCTASMALQDTQLRPSLFLRDDGTVFADVYVARDDEHYLVLAEGPTADELEQWLRSHQTGGELSVQRLDQSHRLFSLHGPWSWDLLAACLGPDVIGMPYLTFLRGENGLLCFRTGKTGEFGYEFLIPTEGFASLREGLVTNGREWELELVTQPALDHCALENWFFNPRREGTAGLQPAELGLQWRVSTKKKAFVGAAALKPLARRLTCVVSEHPFSAGSDVSLDGGNIGSVLQAARSPIMGWWVGSAVLRLDVAVAGVGGLQVGGKPARTLAPPVVNNRSLYVSPQRHTFADRASAQFAPLTLAP